MKILITHLFFIFTTTVFGCDSDVQFSNLDKIEKNDLKEFITHYYGEESKFNWKETYSSRNKAYKEFVTFDMHVKGMEHYGKEWKLSKIEIVDIDEEKDTFHIIMKFHEHIKGDLAEKRLASFNNENGLFEFIDRTIWKKEDDKWVVVRSGTRSHLLVPDVE